MLWGSTKTRTPWAKSSRRRWSSYARSSRSCAANSDTTRKSEYRDLSVNHLTLWNKKRKLLLHFLVLFDSIIPSTPPLVFLPTRAVAFMLITDSPASVIPLSFILLPKPIAGKRTTAGACAIPRTSTKAHLPCRSRSSWRTSPRRCDA